MKKTCLITGANAGIGREAAIQMAAKGYHVIIGCRNQERGESALKMIREESRSSDVSLVLVDMSLLRSIKACVDTIHRMFDRLDVLIHNAAIFDISQKKPHVTEEGYETIWMTNHVGPVYMTLLLEDLLKKSEDGRVVTIASKGLLAMPWLKVDLEDPEFKRRKFSVTKAYYQSKLAQIFYTYWLAKRLNDANITVNCIRVTAVKVDMNRHQDINALQKMAYTMKRKKSLEPRKMAETYVYVATDPSLKGITGRYYDENNQEVSSGKYTMDKTVMEQVMTLTYDYIGDSM